MKFIFIFANHDQENADLQSTEGIDMEHVENTVPP
jgi:hypothetical protein